MQEGLQQLLHRGSGTALLPSQFIPQFPLPMNLMPPGPPQLTAPVFSSPFMPPYFLPPCSNPFNSFISQLQANPQSPCFMPMQNAFKVEKSCSEQVSPESDQTRKENPSFFSFLAKSLENQRPQMNREPQMENPLLISLQQLCKFAQQVKSGDQLNSDQLMNPNSQQLPIETSAAQESVSKMPVSLATSCQSKENLFGFIKSLLESPLALKPDPFPSNSNNFAPSAFPPKENPFLFANNPPIPVNSPKESDANCANPVFLTGNNSF